VRDVMPYGWFSVHTVHEQAKLLCGDRSQDSVTL
jgi:hypothetical protein